MEFDKARVFTPLTADEVQIGSKGYFAETMGNLKNMVEMQGETSELTSIRDETNACRFYCKEYRAAWVLFYLVETPDLCTRRELAQWLAQGNGEFIMGLSKRTVPSTNYGYSTEYADTQVPDVIHVRKWGETDWHKPTRAYMGIEE